MIEIKTINTIQVFKDGKVTSYKPGSVLKIDEEQSKALIKLGAVKNIGEISSPVKKEKKINQKKANKVVADVITDEVASNVMTDEVASNVMTDEVASNVMTDEVMNNNS